MALFCLAGVSLAACQNSNYILSPAAPTPDVKDKFPITVSPHSEILNLSPTLAGQGLQTTDARLITDFAGGYLQDGHGPLSIVLPAIPNTPMAAKQMNAINTVLAERGVPAAKVEWRIATPDAANPAAAPAAGPMVFSYTRYVAAAERRCGEWPKDIARHHDNQPWENFGCAVQNNMAAMVTDPLDLKRPRATTPVDVDRRTVVIKAYRKGEATAAQRTAAEKGTISDVAR
ncbi:unnamed protein product [Phaeothamnion confervicola]